MRSFITGGAGFIGSHLATILSEKGEVRCYDNLSTGKAENTSYLCRGDIRDLDHLTQKMQGYDTVFHLAANTNSRSGITKPQIDLENGLIGTHNVLLAMKHLHIKNLVFTSTCGVYGDAPLAVSEQANLNPICPYAENKMKAEWLIEWFARQYGIQAWILRLGNIVGGIMQNGVIRDLVLRLKADNSRLDVMGSKKPSRAFMCVEDCVDAIIHVLEHSNDQINLFNVAGSGSTNIGQIVKMLLRETDLEDIPVNYEPQDRGWEGSAIEVKLNVDKLRRLGWEAKMSSNMAVKKAIKEIWEYQNRVDKYIAPLPWHPSKETIKPLPAGRW